MRLFFAVELPLGIGEKIFEVGRELEGKGISRTKKENLHITLKFLGEKSEKEAGEIIKRAGVIEFEPFRVKVAGVGAFPNERNARVIWAGAQAKELEELAHKIEEALGMKRENFTGHITIARVRERMELGEFFRGNENAEFGEFIADRFFLKKSTLSPQGAAYEDAAEFRGRKGRE